ncbi:colicin immunity domain-containing protein [Streptomyces sp. CoH27]|uniref:colicin immunity domain-containing protein n=1 Tax=Streptomyces sp. CoH27 TaxID=2875763 RepID=UPI001CD3545D|nr:colicin immunity domain-containing protein [Streptomyces sp. CoH27]
MPQIKNRDVIETVLSDTGNFREDWLARVQAVSVAPLTAHLPLGRETVERVAAGARETGAAAVFGVPLDEKFAEQPAVTAPAEPDALLVVSAQWPDTPGLLLVADNFLGAVLCRGSYALAAGSLEFMRGAVAEGTDRARAEFQRYARRSPTGAAELSVVSGHYPPQTRAFKSAEEASATSHTGQQIDLMRSLASRSIDGPSFARRWLDERRRAMDAGERLGEAMENALDEVFYTLEDYSIDPDLRDPDDLTDEELRDRVAAVLDRLT